MPADTLEQRQRRLRTTQADVARGSDLYLVKNVSELRLTYQIKLLTYFAKKQGGALIVRLPAGARVHPSLGHFTTKFADIIRIERAS